MIIFFLWHGTLQTLQLPIEKIKRAVCRTAKYTLHLFQRDVYKRQGHSYEFDNHDNWNVIEDFCAYMGGRNDIWYALSSLGVIFHFTAVSYTHLASSFTNAPNFSSSVASFLKPSPIRDSNNAVSSGSQCNNPVSYTHLDVYKRQPPWRSSTRCDFSLHILLRHGALALVRRHK